MDMPVARREGRGQSELARKDREPDQDSETGVDGSEQEEGSEAGREKRPSFAGPKSGERDHDRASSKVVQLNFQAARSVHNRAFAHLDLERTEKRWLSRVRLVLISDAR